MTIVQQAILNVASGATHDLYTYLLTYLQVSMSESRHAGALYTPAETHEPDSTNVVPRWSNEHSRTGSARPSFRRRRGRSSNSSSRKRSVIAKIRSKLKKVYRYATKQFNKMNWWQKIGAGLFVFISITAGILVTVFHTELLAMMLPVASKLTYVRNHSEDGAG